MKASNILRGDFCASYYAPAMVINLLDNNAELLNKLISVANEFVKKQGGTLFISWSCHILYHRVLLAVTIRINEVKLKELASMLLVAFRRFC